MRPTRFPWPFIILLITLGCLVGSYVPLVQLGSIAGVHIDLSLLYVTVTIVSIASLKQLWRNRNALISSWPWRLLVVFAIYTTTAALWSPNPTRALFTTGFLWLLVLLASSVIVWWPNLKKESQVVKRILFIGFTISGLVALWQIFSDALGIGNALTLLPAMYQSGHFGVARPVALALEPQFFASLLLIPFAWCSYHFLRGGQRRLIVICLIATSTLLVLTLSRGGLIAATIIAIALVISLKKWRSGILLLGIGCISLVAGSLIIAATATLNTRDTVSGYTADQRAISQITLGVVQLPQQRQGVPSSSQHPQTHTNGYVKSSTASRLSMSEKSIKLWSSSPTTILFGVGTGGFGMRLHQQDSHFPTNSVANNYYLEMLAELGVLGATLFGAFIISLLIILIRAKQWLALSLLLGFLVQWYFFSGNANVIHVWIVIGLSIIISSPKLQRRLIQ